MKLRSYQETFVSKSIRALIQHDGVAGVAATGAGKTVMLAMVAKQYKRVLILQHTTELLDQNSKTFGWVCPEAKVGFVDSDRNDVDSDVVFAMRQTIINRLDQLSSFDLIVIDECHHTPCTEYTEVINHLRVLNPKTKLFGVTATPERADKADMSKYYDTISHKVNIDDLIKLGYLVPPRAYIIESDNENAEPSTEQVISEWKRRCSDRRTVIFCQTVEHAEEVAKAFDAAGVTATFVDGSMPARKRKRRLKDFERGKIQVMCNAQVLTEGYDCQPISCVVILRRSSSKSALIQIVGRGLRKLDPERFPDVVKHDCIVLDFGQSLRNHGNLDSGDQLSFNNHDYEQQIADVLQCPCCGGPIEPRDKQCPLCLHIIERDAEGRPVRERETLDRVKMTELEIFKLARFKYESLRRGDILVSSGWDAWVVVYHYNRLFYTITCKKRCQPKLAACTPNRVEAIATADDFLSEFGDQELAGKQQQWLNEPATFAQMECLPSKYQGKRFSKYMASCLIPLCQEGRWGRIHAKVVNHYNRTGYKHHG